jgi:hypothetical protein
MLELFETNPTVDVQEAEYQRLLDYPEAFVMAGRARELADAARKWFSENGRPWFYVRQEDSVEWTKEKVRVGGAEFSSKRLHDQFAEAQVESAVLVTVSAGIEGEENARELWQEGKPDEYFFMEIFGSAVAEHLIALASGRICGWADGRGAAVLPHHSPGNSGWDISDQIKLWNLIRQNQAGLLEDRLEVLESGMLRPQKSLLAVFGVTRDLETARRLANLIPCETCSLPNCRYRRAPKKRSVRYFDTVQFEKKMAVGQAGAIVK